MGSFVFDLVVLDVQGLETFPGLCRNPIQPLRGDLVATEIEIFQFLPFELAKLEDSFVSEVAKTDEEFLEFGPVRFEEVLDALVVEEVAACVSYSLLMWIETRLGHSWVLKYWIPLAVKAL